MDNTAIKKSSSIILIAVVSLICIGCIALVIWGNMHTSVIEINITDISDYNTEEYSLKWNPIFPETIPENAEVVNFLYYEYYHDFEDYYLELKFDTPEELLEYLSVRVENAESKASKWSYTVEEGIFIEDQNPYNASYVDLFYAGTRWGKADGKCHAGYTIEGSDSDLDVLYSIISYSIDELIVIHEYAATRNYYTTKQKVPEYFIRFGVDTNTDTERWIEFQKKPKNKTDDE